MLRKRKVRLVAYTISSPKNKRLLAERFLIWRSAPGKRKNKVKKMGSKRCRSVANLAPSFCHHFLPGTLSFCAIVCNKSNYILKPEHLKKTRKYQLQAAKVAPARSRGRVVRLPGKSRASKSSISAANAFNLTLPAPPEPIVPKHEPSDDFSS